MAKVKILGISGSHRNGATDYCVKEALSEAAKIPGVETEFISLRSKKIAHCCHCNGCIRKCQTCIIQDDFQEVYDAFLKADGYIVGTPVYEMSATPLLQDFFSRIRPTHMVYPGILANRVGGAISTAGTRNGGQEMANLVIRNFFLTYEILVTGGPSGNYTGACVWSKDQKEEGAKADEIGMERVRGLGKRIAEASLIIKTGMETLEKDGVVFVKKNFWDEKKEVLEKDRI